MRRTIFMALLAALLLAPAALAADPTKILRDCLDDGTLQGDYTASELRDARSNLPTDADEYSDCRDVLARAISAATASKTPTPGPTDSGGGGGGGGTGTSGGSSSGTGDGQTDPSGPTPEEQAALDAPSSAADATAVAEAAKQGDRAITIEASPKSPGAARLAADVGRNGLPTTMVGVLALLAVTLVAACLPLLRRGRGRRVDPDPTP